MHRRLHFGPAELPWDELEAQWMRELGARGPRAEAAWSALFAVYGRLFVKRLMLFGLDPEEAQDAAQELWVEISRAAPRWRGEQPVRVYLLGFLKLARVQHFRRRGRRPAAESLDDEAVLDEVDALGAPGQAAGVAPEDWLDFVRCVRRVFARFELDAPALAQLLLLCHVEGLSLEETAEEVGGDATLAKGRVFTARRRIEPELRPCLELWPNREAGQR